MSNKALFLKVLSQLEMFQISSVSHSQRSLRDHLLGTADILESWNSSLDLCLGGLCHSIYGTESFLKNPATLEHRDYLRGLIGSPAERIAYLFGAHIKDTLWENLSRNENFQIRDRFTDGVVELSLDDLRHLVTLTLANWLEQRPSVDPKHHFIRQEEFSRSKFLLPEAGFRAFEIAYGL